MEPLESRCLLTTITPYLLPKIQNLQPEPAQITIANGDVWFTQDLPSAIGMINPANPNQPQTFTQGLLSPPSEITTGPDGNVWFTEPSAGAIGMINTSAPYTVHNYSLPKTSTTTPVPVGITVGVNQSGKSVIWYTDPTNNAIGMIDPSTPGSPPAEIPLPSNLLGGIGTQIVTGPGGTLWFTEVTYNTSTGTITASAIGSYNPATAQWSQVTLPSGSGQALFGITLGPDNNIWFGEGVPNTGLSGGYLSSGLGMINPSVSPLTITETPIPADQTTSPPTTRLPLQLVTGPDGDIWFTDNATTAIVAFNPTAKTFTPFDAPQVTAYSPIPDGITAGLGNIWFTDASGAVDVATLDTKLVITQPPASVNTGSPFDVTAEVEYGDTNAVDTSYTGSVSIALTSPTSNILGGTTSISATAGVATFTTLTLANPTSSGSGVTLTATAGSLTSAPSALINVTGAPIPQATHLLVYSQSTTSVPAGSPFSLVIVALTGGNALASSYSGPVTLTLENPSGASLGGTTVVTASGGIASFSGLTLNLPGSYIIEATAGGLSSATAAISVPNPPPQVLGASPVHTQNHNKKGKPVGKAILTGYEFTFNMGMNSSINNSGNYQVQIYIPAKGRGRNYKPAHYQTTSYPVSPISSTAEEVVTGTKTSTTFKNGGRIILIGSGISSAAGALLGSNAVYTISRGGGSIYG